MRSHRVLYPLSMLVILVAFISLILFFKEIMFPVTIFSLNRPLRVVEEKAKSGENLTLVIDYCKTRKEISNTSFTLSGQYLLPATFVTTDFPVGCHVKKYKYNLVLSTPTGEYRLIMVKSYPLFIFKGVSYTFISNKFEIVK